MIVLYTFSIKRWSIQMNGVEVLSKQQPILVNDLYIDPVGYQVKLGQREIELTVKEFEILSLFAQNKGKVVRRTELLPFISALGIVDEDRAINVMICRLRKKIETDPHHPKRLVSVRGLGYRLRE
jgi:two-component system, OmpR family, alkaline phosphatase synthesis response regulator PhoP